MYLKLRKSNIYDLGLQGLGSLTRTWVQKYLGIEEQVVVGKTALGEMLQVWARLWHLAPLGLTSLQLGRFLV